MSLSNYSRIAYAIGDTGINFYFITTMSFLLYFYTDIYGISAAAATGVFLVARQVDAFTDPIMGYIADRTRSKWGRFRPYLLFGAIPLGLITIALFTVPNFDNFGKIVWAYITYTLFGILYTVVTIPYAALTSVLTEDHDERATLSTFRMGGAFSGALVVSICLLPFVGFFATEAIGFQVSMMVLALLGTALLWTTFASTKERQTLAKPEIMLSLRDAITSVSRNPPLWTVLVLFVLGMVAFSFRQAATPYYFKYTMGRPDLIADYFTVTLSVMFIALFFIPILSRQLSKRLTVQIGSIVAIIGASGFYLNPPENTLMVFVWGSILAIGGAPIAVLGWAMIPDTVDYAQHKLGIRADGFIFSTATFFQKTGKTIAGAAVPAVLALTGFVANQVQSEFALEGILLCMAIAPLVANILLLLFASLYRLDASEHRRIVTDLKERLAD